MYNIVLAIHILLCLFLIVVVLLQQGKGAELGATFSGGSNTLFGAGGASSLLSRITTGGAILFMVTSVILVKNYPAQSIADLTEAVSGSNALVSPLVSDEEISASEVSAESSTDKPSGSLVDAVPGSQSGTTQAAPLAESAPKSEPIK